MILNSEPTRPKFVLQRIVCPTKYDFVIKHTISLTLSQCDPMSQRRPLAANFRRCLSIKRAMARLADMGSGAATTDLLAWFIDSASPVPQSGVGYKYVFYSP